jgi:hypothetical protein
MPDLEPHPSSDPGDSSADAQVSAKEHVGEAHQILKRLRLSVHDHPELDLAIERLEEALAALNLQTGGML